MYAHEKSANLVKIYLHASVTKRDKGIGGGGVPQKESKLA